MRKTTSLRQRGSRWGMMDRLQYLDFADDICLMAQRFHDMEEKLTNLQEVAKRGRLNVNVNKTKEMRVNNKIQGRLTVYRQEIEQVERPSLICKVL
jgi:hypothetical protein